MQFLTFLGADANIPRATGESPLFVASRCGNTAIITQLLRAGTVSCPQLIHLIPILMRYYKGGQVLWLKNKLLYNLYLKNRLVILTTVVNTTITYNMVIIIFSFLVFVIVDYLSTNN